MIIIKNILKMIIKNKVTIIIENIIGSDSYNERIR